MPFSEMPFFLLILPFVLKASLCYDAGQSLPIRKVIFSWVICHLNPSLPL
ncbi:MAG: hypothetical protein K0S07_1334 [Chlamydiales bacterium]|jgi:hypothetical protein|nr:hypothetical protein [Chlamydiales bacterium]